jgi:hypothetical protein
MLLMGPKLVMRGPSGVWWCVVVVVVVLVGRERIRCGVGG